MVFLVLHSFVTNGNDSQNQILFPLLMKVLSRRRTKLEALLW